MKLFIVMKFIGRSIISLSDQKLSERNHSFLLCNFFQKPKKPDIFSRYNDIDVIKPKRPEETNGKVMENGHHLPDIKITHQNGHNGTSDTNNDVKLDENDVKTDETNVNGDAVIDHQGFPVFDKVCPGRGDRCQPEFVSCALFIGIVAIHHAILVVKCDVQILHKRTS